MHCAKGFSFWSLVSLRLRMMPRTELMREQTHKRNSSRRMMCAIAALVLLAAPMSGFGCTGGHCLSQSSKATAGCSGMEMPKDVTPVGIQSTIACCQIMHDFPVTISVRTATQKARAELLPVVLGSMRAGLARTERAAPRPVESSPPRNVQSLFCTLLI